MPRSASPYNIFRDPDPTAKPFIVGRVPSAEGGNVLDVSYGLTPEGKMPWRTTPRGQIQATPDPFFYLCVFGNTLSMSQNDMHECVEELVDTRQKKARQNPRPVANARQLKNKVGDLIESVKDAEVGRSRFAVGDKRWSK